MNQYQQPVGRGLELVVATICLGIGILFWWLAALVIINVSFGIAAVVGTAVLVIIGFWFSGIAYRLLLRRRNSGGGLLSTISLQVWCIVLGMSSIGLCGFAIYMGEPKLFIGGSVMAVACWSGLKLSMQRRATSHENT